MFGYIYKTTNLINNKIYIGKHKASTFEPENYLGSGKILKQAILKYGKENFKNEILDTADTALDLCKKEEQWILALDARNPSIGYNIAKGGEGGDIVSGYVWYNDGEIEYYLSPDIQPDQTLQKGRLVKIDNTDTVWINNGSIQKHIKNNLLASYLEQGWTTGMLDRGDAWRKNVAASINKLQATSEWQTAHKTGIDKYWAEHPHQTNKTSWKPGHATHNKGKVSVTNGVVNKFINEKELELFLKQNPDWYRGNTQKHTNKRNTNEMLEALKKNESFTYNKLSPEEMKARGILGRLVGPCAEFTIPTRNGRKYNETLWDKVFSDDIVIEKINNKCLFGELGHPADREEVDPEKIALALNEIPKKNSDGQLIACFDILDTPTGKILKALCDYGSTIGISSRGSGDIITGANGEELVDPDTYNFECFDAVLLPAVKSARLSYMRESFDRNAAAMKKALTESLQTADEKDRAIMEEALGNLHITLDEAMDDEIVDMDGMQVVYHKSEANTPVGKFDFTMDDSRALESLNEEADEDVEEGEDIEATDEAEAPVEEVEETKATEDEVEEEEKDLLTLVQEKLIPEDEIKGEADEGYNKAINEVSELIAAQKEEQPEKAEDKEEDSDDKPVAETDESPEEAVDDGADEVIESLKDMVRQKDLLEAEVKSLKNEKTVSDTKATALAEELDKYKTAFGRVSELASKSTKFEKQVKELNEQLNAKDAQLKELQNKAINNTALNESINKAASEKAKLTQKISDMQSEMQETEKKLNEQLSARKAEVEKKTKIALSYKAKFESVVNKYIDTKASMLGVQSSEIRSRLTEGFSLEEVDKVCDEFLSNTRAAKLPFVGRNSGMTINESKGTQKAAISKNDDLYDLYELAGLN